MELVGFFLNILILCYKYSGSVTSFGRTRKHNKAVGGVDNSYHLIWYGCDVVLDDNQKNPQFESDAKDMGFLALWEKDHYHLQRG